MSLYREKGFYEKYVKRVLDIFFSLVFLVIFCWLYFAIAVVVRMKLGSPVLFRQPRPGMLKNGKESIFDMYKFRTMSDRRDDQGNLLPDDQRLSKFGALLRSTSLDELPEVFSILKGDMSFVGPRPQLVRDMVFMSDEQRLRHTAKPGLTGLAQVNGRNAISWNEKFEWDLKYIKKISFASDVKIILSTIAIVLQRHGITDGENASALDYGDVLLKQGKISKETYDDLQAKAQDLIIEHDRNKQ